MTTPTIAHVLHRLDLAGAEVLVSNLARAYQNRFRFVFLCLDGTGPLGRNLSRDGFEVVDLRRRPGLDWRVARRLAQVATRCRVALFHAHQYTPFVYASASRLLMRIQRTRALPMLFTEHGRHLRS